jgi:hypothetical protein
MLKQGYVNAYDPVSGPKINDVRLTLLLRHIKADTRRLTNGCSPELMLNGSYVVPPRV